MTEILTAPPGLEGLVVADTTVGGVRGEEGYYHYREHSAPQLAETVTLEEAWHLVHRGHLPSELELAEFIGETASLRPLPDGIAEVLPAIASKTPLQGLRTAVSLVADRLELRPWLDTDEDTVAAETMRLTAMMPTLIAALWRVRQGTEPVAPDPELPYATDYLRMINGTLPDPKSARAVEQYLMLTIDHGFNASTFTSRVITSTGADVGAALVGAIGALSGPLHGGAPSRALDMLTEIGEPERAAHWVQAALANGERIMGFGHRVYRTEDPRSALLKRVAESFDDPLADLAIQVEKTILDALTAHKPDRPLKTNVEYYAGVVLHLAGLPQDLFTPSFAASRTIGWTAHIREQVAANRLIRPRARYVGPQPAAAYSPCE